MRQQATTESNVVTYEVVISAPNADLKLKPGLTANVTIFTLEKNDVLTVSAFEGCRQGIVSAQDRLKLPCIEHKGIFPVRFFQDFQHAVGGGFVVLDFHQATGAGHGLLPLPGLLHGPAHMPLRDCRQGQEQ